MRPEEGGEGWSRRSPARSLPLLRGRSVSRGWRSAIRARIRHRFSLPPGAIIDCLLFHDSKVQAIALDDISDYVARPDHVIWVELDSPDGKTVARLGEEFGLHELALEDAISTHQRPKIEEY